MVKIKRDYLEDVVFAALNEKNYTNYSFMQLKQMVLAKRRLYIFSKKYDGNGTKVGMHCEGERKFCRRAREKKEFLRLIEKKKRVLFFLRIFFTVFCCFFVVFLAYLRF